MNKRTAPCPAFQCIRFLPLVAALGYPVSSYSVTFELANGEINGRIDTSLSAGLSVSTANPDIDLIPTAYGGRAGGINGNDARQNFEKGDVISNVYRGTTEISLNYQNYGAFVRGKYWYDHWLETKNGRFKDFDDSGFDNLAKFKGVELMDAYVWGEFNVADRPLDIRIGKQVVNWGESTFIQGGINVINPIDVNAINKPGIEIKEALIPVNMINASLGITDNLTVEAFYQLEWQKTVLPGCGTFFAGNDVMQPGCGPAYAVSGLTEEQQENMSLVNPMLPSFSNMVIEREEDDKPSDSGQWGVSFRYFAE